MPGGPPLTPGGYDRYGFRVPTVVVSPWARANYVSNVVQDHTSITAFIERKWNLPAMTFRDANAHPMTDYFDFRHPAFAQPPRLHAMPGLARGQNPRDWPQLRLRLEPRLQCRLPLPRPTVRCCHPLKLRS